MVRQNAVSLSLVAGALLIGAAPAFADGCPSSAVEVDAALAQRAPNLRASVRDAIESQPNIDRCARVRLAARSNAIRVSVELADGRATERTVAQETDVVPTLAALLVLPQPTEGAEAPSAEAAPAEPAAPQKTAEPTSSKSQESTLVVTSLNPSARSKDSTSSPHTAPSARFGMELSGLTGVRAGAGQVSVGVGALSLVERSGWLIGFAGRADQYHALGPDDSSGSAIELALMAGHRWRTGNTAFDVLLGPSAVLQGTTTVDSRSNTGDFTHASSSSTAPRFILGARASFFARSTWRPFIGIDSEFGPERAAGTDLPDAPRLPVWTIGLCTGLTVGT